MNRAADGLFASARQTSAHDDCGLPLRRDDLLYHPIREDRPMNTSRLGDATLEVLRYPRRRRDP